MSLASDWGETRCSSNHPITVMFLSQHGRQTRGHCTRSPPVPSSRAPFYASVEVESKVRCLVFKKVFQNRSKSISDDFTIFFSIL